jgi:two-component sensor histidine kinase
LEEIGTDGGPVEVSPAQPSTPLSNLQAASHYLMQESPVPMAELEGARHVVRYANPAFFRLVGKSREAVVGKPFADAMQEGDTCLEVLDRVYGTGAAETHTESEHPGRHPAYWSYTMWPVLNEQRRSIGVMMQVTETTLFHQQAGAMNEALLISSVQQHEQTERAETLNEQLRAEIVERKRVEGALGDSEANLAAELEAMQQLQEISSTLIREGDTEALYRKIINAAVTVMGSQAASIQALHPGRGQLRLIGSKGFHPESTAYWEWVSLGSGSTCGLALNSGKRVVVPDIENCELMAGSRDLDEYRRSCIRAVQSTPLVSRTGRLLGMISTHWRLPHDPRESDLHRLDLLARQAADLIERKEAELHQQLLINELNHRVKNMLATVQAIAGQTFRGARADPNAREAFEARLIALSDAHSILTQEDWEGAEIHAILARVVEPHTGRERLRVQGPPIRLSPKAALALAMGLHELATNAVKYGALSNRTGKVAVTWAVEGSRPGSLHLQWRESGGPTVTPPNRKGFGSRLIERNLPLELNGQAKIEYRAEGIVCTVTSALE